MKIAVIFDGLGFGGIERVGVDYIKLLCSLGHDITVYNLNPKQNDMEQELEKGIDVIHHNFPRNICPHRYAVLKRKGYLGTCLYAGAYTCFSLAMKFNYVLNHHKSPQYDIGIAFSGHYNDLTFLAEGFVKTNKKVAWLHGGIADYAMMSKGFLKLYAKIKNLVTLSSMNEMEVLHENRFLKNLHIQKIYNPSFIEDKVIDDVIVNQLKAQYGEFILMIGRFTFEKDHRTVVDAMEHLKTRYGIYNKLLLVGDGENREEIQQYVAKKHLEDSIIFIGKRYDVQNFYKAAKVYVHASPAEGLPTVLIEAMKFGVPIVTTDSKPGVPEVLENGRCGIVCALEDSLGLAKGINSLLKDEVLYQKYVELGIKSSSRFEPKTIQKELEQYLNEIK